MLFLIIIPIPRVFSTGKYKRGGKKLFIAFLSQNAIYRNLEARTSENQKLLSSILTPERSYKGSTSTGQTCPGSKGLNSSDGETASGKATFLQLILFADTDSGILRG